MKSFILLIIILGAFYLTNKEGKIQTESKDLSEFQSKKVIRRFNSEDSDQLKELGLDANSVTYEVISPNYGIQKQLDLKKKSFAGIYPKVIGAFKYLPVFLKYIESISSAIVFFSIAIIVFLRLIKLWPLLRIISNFIFKLSKVSFLIFSISSIFYAYFMNYNLWRNSNFYWLISSLLCIGSFGIYIYDFNYPIWRKLYTSFIFPVISGIVISIVL